MRGAQSLRNPSSPHSVVTASKSDSDRSCCAIRKIPSPAVSIRDDYQARRFQPELLICFKLKWGVSAKQLPDILEAVAVD